MISLNKIKNLKSITKFPEDVENLDFYLKVDNRLLCAKSIFIAIVGERFNPLKHLDKVVKEKCRFVICENSQENLELIKDFEDKIKFILVNDIENFIQEAGKEVSNYFKESGGILVGISGSNGKTTTKEMLFDLLTRELSSKEVICTQKNNNNHLGVPFTLFQINELTKIAIVELGSNHPGEIEVLCKILNPQFGVTTNIGDTHLEFFNNRENVFKEESVLKNYCISFFQNMDDQYLSKLEPLDKWTQFGESSQDKKFIFDKSGIKINDEYFKNENITGKHNFTNLGVAVLIAKKILKDSNTLVDSVSEFVPTANRSEWLELNEKSVFLDAYNANPSSMKLAVLGFFEHLDSIGAKREDSLLILGDMNELGDSADLFHTQLGEFLKDYSFGKVFFVGKYAKSYALGFSGNSSIFESVAELKDKFREENKKFVFIKGSRSLQLETILDIR